MESSETWRNRSFEVLCHKQNQNARSISGQGRPDTPSEGIRITYPDRILSFHPAAANLHPAAAAITPGCRRHYTRLLPPFHPTAATFHLDVLHPAHSIQIFCIRRMTPDGRGGRFKLPRMDISGSAYSAYQDGRAAILHKCYCVLLKLPDICHRHFGIFWDILL